MLNMPVHHHKYRVLYKFKVIVNVINKKYNPSKIVKLEVELLCSFSTQ